ncbi:hypothetical protein, partial [Stutzerimonas stutzeri]|uniref:hypothetical protein n=1 Tax=Stutzerimonas stutzeri TaxID=316 RepID=UPI003D01B1A2
WSDTRGMGGRITVESVVRCSWNGWPDDRGIRIKSTDILIAPPQRRIFFVPPLKKSSSEN